MSLRFGFALLVFLLGHLSLDFMIVGIKTLRISGFDIVSATALRNFGAFVVTFFLLIASSQGSKSKSLLKLENWRVRQWRLLVFRGLVLAVSQLCLYAGLLHVTLAISSTMMNLLPMFVLLMSIPLLGQRIGIYRWSAVGLGLSGVVMVLQPWSDAFSWYALLPAMAAFGYGTTMVISKMADQDIPSALMNLYSIATAVIATGIAMLIIHPVWPPVTVILVLIIVGVGVCAGLGQFLLIVATRMDSPANLAPFNYIELFFALALGWLFFREWPVEQLLPGVVLMISAGLIIIWRERVKSRSANISN